MVRALVALLLLVAAPGAALAQPEPGTYRLVDGRSAAHISVDSAIGSARLALPASGEITFGTDGSVTGGRLVLDARNMRADAMTAQQMRGPEGFDVARHPRANVAITGGSADGASITLEGRLTVRGETHAVRLSGDVLRARGRRLAAELTGSIDRTLFGIVAGRPLYGRRAAVRLRLVASR